MASVQGSMTSRQDPPSVVSSVDDTNMRKISVHISPVSVSVSVSSSCEIPLSSTNSVSAPNISLLSAAC